MQQDVHAILQLGEAQIQKSARALIDAARNEATKNCLPSCLVWKLCAQ
ncbi:hypothetical protein ACVXHA_00695 [Escherichia coli]